MTGFRWPAGGPDPDRFGREYWQEQPLLLPDALPFAPPLDPDDIAGLATLAGVEAQVIRTVPGPNGPGYRVQHGPFTDAQLMALGERDWTLLVHDVDKHLPEAATLLRTLCFLPHWRLDNLMVSVAAPGGSVGAHADSYDVFLLQGHGTRRWQLAPAGAGTPVAESSLRLRQDVVFTQAHTCHCGDILYVPPGTIHHGVAQSLATTWSLGLQAPLLADIAALAGGRLDPDIPSKARYRDPIGTVPTAHAIQALDPDALGQLPIRDAGITEIAVAFGRLVTALKPSLQQAPANANTARCRHLSPLARLAWVNIGHRYLVFANGQASHTDAAGIEAMEHLQATHGWPADGPTDLHRWLVGTAALLPTVAPCA
ncbi:MAG: cupin domain-containing protein [Pseudomonadota bacterium]